MTEEELREHEAELNRQRVKRCNDKVDTITLRLPKGTVEAIREAGYVPATFAKEALLDKMKKSKIKVK